MPTDEGNRVRITVKLPKLSDAGGDAAVVEWLVPLGAAVVEGSPLVRVETAKAIVEVPAPVSGVLVDQLAEIDDELMVGDPLGTIET